MYAKELMQQAKQALGIDAKQSKIPADQLPQSNEELELHMQLSYKQSVEIAEEEAITTTLASNRWPLTKRRINEDLVVCGIACAKTSFNKTNGIVVDYVDPANLIYSYTEDPNFEDVYYVGEVKSITIPELKNNFLIYQKKNFKEYKKCQVIGST